MRSPAGRFLAVSGLARLSFGIDALAFVVYVEAATDSFATAGVALGAFGLTSGVLAPLRGALIDRRGRAVLVAFALAYAACLFALALTDPAGPGALSYVLLAAAAGALAPPFGAWTRASLARALRGDELSAAYAVDGVLEESAFVFGPLIAAVVIVATSAGVALAGAALLALVSAVALAYAPRVGRWSPPRRTRATTRRPLNRPLLLAIACLAGTGVALGFIEVAVPAFADAHGSAGTAGVALATFSVGGVLGSLAYGARHWRSAASRRYAVLLATVGAGLALLPLADSLAALSLLIVLPGLAFLPALVTNSLLIEELSPRGPTAAAFAGVTTATNTGFAAGAAIAGSVVESSGTDTAFLIAAAVAAASALPALALPARRGDDRPPKGPEPELSARRS